MSIGYYSAEYTARVLAHSMPGFELPVSTLEGSTDEADDGVRELDDITRKTVESVQRLIGDVYCRRKVEYINGKVYLIWAVRRLM